jgi:hypothetical protein
MVGRTFHEHLLNMRKVYRRFREAHPELIPEKCQLFQKEVFYFGLLSPEGITTDPKKRKAVREWPTPKNKHEFRSFLSVCTYYSRFLSGFANIAKPPTKVTEEEESFQWTADVEAAFETLK